MNIYLRAIVFGSLLLTNSSFAQEINSSWTKNFFEKKWQDFQGLSCGSNNISFKDGNIEIFQFGKTTSKKYKVELIDDKERLIELSTTHLFKDTPAMISMFPQWADKPSGRVLYSFKVTSDHRALHTRKTRMVDLMAMLKEPNTLIYDPEKTDSYVIFDCN